MASSTRKRKASWRGFRITILLLLLGFVALDAWLTRWRATDWDYSLRASIYPIVADGQPATVKYVAGLQREDFETIERFFESEARRHALPLSTPVRVTLRAALSELPPQPPAQRGMVGTMWWSLKLRFWASRMEKNAPRPRSEIRIFVLYYDPAKQPVLAHSLGLQKGLVGVVHAFASREMAPTNNVVIAHELLHTLGASDKYHPGNGLPRYPDGYAEPAREPRYPQPAAELMAGRIALAESSAEIPDDLNRVVLGPLTTREIGWSQRP